MKISPPIEDRVAAVFEQAAVGMGHLSLEGKWLQANPKLCEIVGYAAAELLERSVLDLMHSGELDGGAFMAPLLAGLAQSDVREEQYLRKDGSLVWVRRTLSLLRRPCGTPDAFFALVEDIDAAKRVAEQLRRRVEQQQRQNESSLQMAMDAAKLGTWDHRVSGEAYWSPRTRELWGLPADAAPTLEHFFACMHPGDRPRIQAAIQRATDPSVRAHYEVEYRLLQANGRVRWIAGTGKAQFERIGGVDQLAGMVGIVCDITRQKEAEAALLRDSEARIALIVNTSTKSIFTVDERGVIEFANPAALYTFGYAEEELIGRNVKLLMPEPYASQHDGILKEYLDTGKRGIIDSGREVVARRKDGSTFPAFVSVGEGWLGEKRIFTGFVEDLSAQKRAEADVRQTAELLRAVAEGTTDAVFVKDICGRYLWFNEAASRFVKRPIAEVLGQDDTALFDPASARFLMDRDRRVMISGTAETETEKLTAAGIQRYFMSTKAPYRDAHGNIIGIVGISRDVTRQKAAEAEILKLNQDLLRKVAEWETLFRVIPIGIAVTEDPGCTQITMNPALAKLFRLPLDANPSKHAPDNDAGRRFKFFYDGREVPREELPLPAAMRLGRPVTNSELQLVREDGSTRFVTTHAAPLFDEGGQARGAIGVYWDITDFKATEELRAAKEAAEAAERTMAQLNVKLRRKVSELEALFHLVPIGIAVAEDAQCRQIRPNAAFARMLRIDVDANASATAPVHQRPEHFTCWQDGRQLRPEELPMQLAAATGQAVENVELELRFTDGHVTRFQGSAVPLFDEDGQSIGCVAGFSDIADLKRIEDRLRAAKDAAEAANRSKDQFLATISHELRTPISAILIWANLLKSHHLSETDKAAAAETILQCAKDQAQLVNELLDASRLLYGKVKPEMATLDLAGLLKSAAQALRPAMEARQIALHLSLADATILGDATLLRQAIGNLLTNAIKFTPEGGEIRVRLNCQEDQAHIQIEDTGEGISAEFLPHLFDSFRQADSSSTRKHGGLGLGLSIVKHLVELHGGTVEASSAGVGLGACFRVWLPLKIDGESEANGQAEGVRYGADLGASTLAGLHLLVIEDDRSMRESLCFLLNGLGASVSAAASVKEARGLMARRKPDLLICDIAMPGEDGYAFIGQIRASEALSNSRIPVIALTAYAGEEDRAEALARGFDLHMAKPVDPERLVKGIMELMGQPD